MIEITKSSIKYTIVMAKLKWVRIANPSTIHFAIINGASIKYIDEILMKLQFYKQIFFPNILLFDCIQNHKKIAFSIILVCCKL